jgi:hypothetical protein
VVGGVQGGKRAAAVVVPGAREDVVLASGVQVAGEVGDLGGCWGGVDEEPGGGGGGGFGGSRGVAGWCHVFLDCWWFGCLLALLKILFLSKGRSARA